MAAGKHRWQAQRAAVAHVGYEPGAWRVEAAVGVAPIHHRRESACSLDIGFVPAALQRVGSLRPLLLRALAPVEVEGTHDHAAQFTATYAWTTPGCRQSGDSLES